jgi:hypothetical protein
VRPNPDSLAHQQEAAAVTMVVQVVEDLVVDSEVAWAVVVVAVAVKSTSPTFVTSLLFLWQHLSSFILT